jgi:hypothetical protein
MIFYLACIPFALMGIGIIIMGIFMAISFVVLLFIELGAIILGLYALAREMIREYRAKS